MAMLALGPYAFKALGFSYKQRQRMIETKWAEIEVAGDMNSLQWHGGQSEKEIIRGVLFSEFGGGGSLAGLQQAQKSGVVLPLVSLGGTPFNVFGLQSIQRIEEDHSYIDERGSWRKNAYTIEVRTMPGTPDIFSTATRLFQALFS